MADVKWIKIVTDIFDDEKILLIESMPDADAIIVIWFKLLCLAGKQNNGGVFMLNDRIPYTEEMFATIFRRKPNTVKMALHTFEEFGMIEIINSTVTIPNWHKHQSLDTYERQKEKDRLRKQKMRAEQRTLLSGKRLLSTDTSEDASTDESADKSTDTSEDVHPLDKKKIREDKKEKDGDDDGEKLSDKGNPFGDFDPHHQLDPDSLVAYAASNLRSMNHDNMTELTSFRDSLPDELIRHAINEACGNGAPVYNYVRSILNSYVDNELKTMADVKAYEDEKRKKASTSRQTFGKSASMPDPHKTYDSVEDFY